MAPERKSHWARAREILAVEGWRSLWFKILGETVYRRLLIIQKEVASRPEPPPIPASKPLSADEIGAYLRFRPDTERETIQHRLASGQQAFVVWQGETIVHACWTVRGGAHIDYLGLDIRLAPDTVYVYEVFTSPECRGQSISSVRSLQMEDDLFEPGMRRLVAAVGPENWAAVRSKSKAGYHVAGIIGCWSLGGFKYPFCHYRDGPDGPLRLSRRGE